MTSLRSTVEPSLRPAQNVQKLLISTTSRLVGQLEDDNMLIAHANPSHTDSYAWARMSEGPSSRSAYVVAFRTEPPPEPAPGLIVPSYGHVGDIMCSYLSVLFGKRFDHHGELESSGFFVLPSLAEFGFLTNQSLPQNTHSERSDYAVPLNLVEATRLRPLIFDQKLNEQHVATFRAASKFYRQALQTVERDPEVAYLNLITAGEILANGLPAGAKSLHEPAIAAALSTIAAELEGGPKIARMFASRLRQIKRRFTGALVQLVDERFFAHPEAKQVYSALKRDGFVVRMGAAYDLRSQYVHSGADFGRWIRPRGTDNDEVQLGKPVVKSASYASVLAKAPTYVGLERTIRYALLKFAEREGLITPPLNDPPRQ